MEQKHEEFYKDSLLNRVILIDSDSDENKVKEW